MQIDIEKLLGENFEWPQTLSTGEFYTRLHDDHDGTDTGEITVIVGPDGDAWVRTQGKRNQALRFRTQGGGGKSLRTRNALLILAEAIRLDNLGS